MLICDVESHIATIAVFRHTGVMGQKFHGTQQELRDKLLPLGLDGASEEQPNGVLKFKCRDIKGEDRRFPPTGPLGPAPMWPISRSGQMIRLRAG